MRFLRIALPLALIALCLMLTDGRAALARLADVSPGWMIATLCLLNAVTLLSAMRWRMTAAALDLRIPMGEAVREYYLAQLANQTLPGGVLGDAARAVRSRKGGTMRRAAQAVVLERVAGQAAMATVALCGVCWKLVSSAPRLTESAAVPLALWLPAGLLSLLLAAGGVLAIAGSGERRDAWRTAAHRSLLHQFPAQATLSLIIALLTVAAFVTAARATGSVLSPGMAALIVPLILTAMLLPTSVAGWGWREGAAAALFPMAGLSPETGLAASIAFGIAALISALPGAFFVTRTRTAHPK